MKNSIPEVTEDVSDLLNKLQQEPNVKLWKSDALVDYAKNLNVADSNLLNFLTNEEYGEKTLSSYTAYLEEQNKVIDLQTLKTKALTVAKNAMVNVGIALASTLIVNGISWVIKQIDDYINRLDIAKEKLSETEDELGSVDSEIVDITARIKELESIGTLSLTDKEELERLREENKELAIRKKYLEDIKAQESEDVVQYTKEKVRGNYGETTSREDIDAYKGYMDNPEAYGSQYYESDVLTIKIAQYEKYQELRKQALEDGDFDSVELLDANLKQLEESLIADRTALQGFKDDLSLTGESSEELDNVNQKLKFIDDLLLAPSENLKNFLNSDAISNDTAKLKELVSSGELTEEQFKQSFSAINSYLEENNLSFQDLISTLEIYKDEIEGATASATKFTKTKMIDTINSMADGFDVLDDIYADVLDGETFDFTKLDTSKFSEAFSEITPEYEKFIETVSSSPTDIDACQGAFNDLVSAFINSKGILSGLTEENKDLTISMLQNMGVANAEDIVLAHLNGTVQELALYKQFTAEKGYELANASYAEAAEFLNEAEASAVAKQELAQLALEKINVNENQISTASDIDNIITLAEAARAGTAELAQLAKAKSVLSAVESAGNRERAGISEKAYQDALKTVEQINNGTFKYNYQKIDRSKFSVADYDVKPKYSGAKTTADAIEKANKSASDSAKDAAEEAKDEYNKFYDFMEIRNERLNDSFELLEKGIENVVGAFAKNNIIDAQLGNIEESINNNTDALAMYKKQAENVLSTIDNPELRDKIVNGAVELTDIQGENADQVKSAIEAYNNWNGKIQETAQKLQELRQQLEDLELQKFTNIVEDFNDMFDIRENSKDLLDKQIDLIKESGNLVGESLFSEQISQSQKQLALLEEEKAKLVSQMNESLSSGRVQVGSEAWISMLDHIQEVEESILDVKTNIEELDTELLNLHYEVFEKVQENFDNIGSELDNLAGLFDDELEIKVSDGNGNWTDEALGQLGLLAQNLELSKYRVTEYGKEIEKLSQDYLDGKYTLLEYQEKLAELSQEQWNCVESVESLEDAIVNLNQTRIDEEIETIEDEIDVYEKLIDTQLELIDETEELRKKREDLAEKSKSVTDIEKQLASMQNDDSQATIAKRKLLEEELANAKKDLENAEHEYFVESQKSALEQQLQDYTDARNAEIEALRLSLENRELLISQSFENVKQNASTVGEQIALIAQQHGIVASNAIISPWTQGENAIASYGETLSVQSSAFIGNIIGVENEVYNLQNEANVASVALSNMFATRADNLVGQLQASWYAEDNLNYATGILQQSLVNTLERGYNIGGITSALGGIQSGLNGVADAANRAAQAIQNALGAQAESKKYYHIGASTGTGGTKWYIKDLYGNEIKHYGSYANAAKDLEEYKKKNYNYTISGYAKGGVIKKDNNPLTPIANYLGEDTVIVGKEGERVLTQKQNDLFETMVKNLEQNGNNFQWNIPNLVVPNNIPLLEKVNRPNITINYDKMYEINGDIYDAHQFENKVAKISKNQTTKILNDINRDFRIHNR